MHATFAVAGKLFQNHLQFAVFRMSYGGHYRNQSGMRLRLMWSVRAVGHTLIPSTKKARSGNQLGSIPRRVGFSDILLGRGALFARGLVVFQIGG